MNAIIEQRLRLLEYAVNDVKAKAQVIQSVLANHSVTALPATTTAITTGATSMGTVNVTAKGSGNFRFNVVGALFALNTLQSIITPSWSFTLNGTNTISAAVPTFALPGNTSSPTVGFLVSEVELFAAAAVASNTTIWTKNPTVGQTVAATLSLGGSATGGSAPAGAILVFAQEIF